MSFVDKKQIKQRSRAPSQAQQIPWSGIIYSKQGLEWYNEWLKWTMKGYTKHDNYNNCKDNHVSIDTDERLLSVNSGAKQCAAGSSCQQLPSSSMDISDLLLLYVVQTNKKKNHKFLQRVKKFGESNSVTRVVIFWGQILLIPLYELTSIRRFNRKDKTRETPSVPKTVWWSELTI